jgi:hypothetical protein
MYPIIAQAIAAEQAADMRRAADAYRRTRGIRKQARAARPGRAIAASDCQPGARRRAAGGPAGR